MKPAAAEDGSDGGAEDPGVMKRSNYRSDWLREGATRRGGREQVSE